MTIFTWSLMSFFVGCYIHDLYYWGMSFKDKPCQDKKRPKPILEGSAIYKHPLLVEVGIKDPASEYELITDVEYYDDSRGVRQYRSKPLLLNK